MSVKWYVLALLLMQNLLKGKNFSASRNVTVVNSRESCQCACEALCKTQIDSSRNKEDISLISIRCGT